MDRTSKHYVDGTWVDPIEGRPFEVVDPATEQVIARVRLGGAADVDRAVGAARRAFTSYAEASRRDRIALLERLVAAYRARLDDLAAAISSEMGAPRWLAESAHVQSGLVHLTTALGVLSDYPFEELRGSTRIVREPIGVCGLITPWNWPANQILCKVAPALAAGCTMVLKPSESTPLSAIVIAEIMEAAGVPEGAFNMVFGDGAVGAAIAAHRDVDMVSFTGSTRAGILVAKAAADTVKRVTQELGGKSANILLEDANLEEAVRHGVQVCFRNSGQSCNAPSRMLVHRSRHAEALAIAKAVAAELTPGAPEATERAIGPVASKAQYDRIQALIQKGIDEGAKLVCGGLGRPPGIDQGYYVRPTVFGDVRNDMTIAREEIFGPVLAVLAYDDEQDAIAIANDTEYGLSGYVQSSDRNRAIAVASKLRTGQVHINGAAADFKAPFGGYRKSGNGREWGIEGMSEYLETKALMGVGG